MSEFNTRKMVLIATAVVGLAVGAMVVERKMVKHVEVMKIEKTK